MIIPEDLAWVEVTKPLDPSNSGLFSIIVIDDNLLPHLVGTGFIISAQQSHATAISAAHCLEEIRKILHPNPKHNLSTPTEFLPPPNTIDFSRIKALYRFPTGPQICPLQIGVWDERSDIAAFNIIAPNPHTNTFEKHVLIENHTPEVGDEVALLGFGKMKMEANKDDPRKGTIRQTLTMRVGRVLSIHPAGSFMLRGPCFETSAAIYSGMSGGIVARSPSRGAEIRAIGFISHAPDPQPNTDQRQSGHSMAGLIRADIVSNSDGTKSTYLSFDDIRVGLDQKTKNNFPFHFTLTE